MRVQVNGRYLVQRVTGMQRYAREIVARNLEHCDVVRPAGMLRGSIGHSWEQFVLPCRMRRGILWSPCSTGPLAVRNQIVTIHDCAFHDHADCFAPSFAAWLKYLVPRLARRAQRVITVSHYSAERICEVCDIDREKITVVYNGVDAKFVAVEPQRVAAVRKHLNLPAQYVLCVGSLEPRKNLRRLLQAWNRLGPAKDGLKLVLVGALSNVFRKETLPAVGSDVVFAGYIADDDLPAVYAGAEAFVYPSLYEGFGLPVLEAMACGAPVVCSETTSLPEVTGAAAIAVDPLDVAAIASGLLRLLEDSRLRQSLRAAGMSRARSFTWDRAASGTWDVLRAAIV
jgi:glycosyltransferase involved in cell wall biosynthesis